MSGSRSALGSNARRVEVLACNRHHAEPLLAEPLVLGLVALLPAVVDRDELEVLAPSPGARASSWSGAPFTKQRTTSRPDSSVIRWKVAISL